jgi:hypothetical protein
VVNFWDGVDNPDASHVNDHKSVGCESRFFTGNAFEEYEKGKSRGELRGVFTFLSPLYRVICKPAWYKALYEEKL